MTSSLTQEGPCALFRLCARVSAAAESLATETALLACLPPTPLPLECFDCVLALRRFSLPSVTPNAARLWREREKENRKERTGLFQRTNFHSGERRSQTKGQLDLTFLPFTKKTNSSTVIVTGWGVGPLPPGALLQRGTSRYGPLTTWKLHLPIK